MPSSDDTSAAFAARRAFLAPAHPADSVGNNSPVTQIKITPQQIGFSTNNKPLSRKQRRRLRRQQMAK